MNAAHYIKTINLYLCENFKVGRYASLLSKTPSLAAIRSQNRSSQPRIVHPLHQIQSKRSRSTAHAKLNRHNPRHSSSHVNPQLRSGLTLNRTKYCLPSRVMRCLRNSTNLYPENEVRSTVQTLQELQC